eukprot:TRINITY_DN50075_c0_g1_i1.p1 TRINITY_DN50075_c0_g1~~TRINITY_DN50075_c0_g1_i1.p1  ORF type:complete len:162 (+),score=13.30 TRINITY_DN50075_c0_g1_i1:75-488(+)
MSQKLSQAAADALGVDRTLDRITAMKGVLGYIVFHPRDGSLLSHSNLRSLAETEVGGDAVDDAFIKEVAEGYAIHLHRFVDISWSFVRELSASDDLTCLRLMTNKYEIVMMPDPNKTDYVIAIFHAHPQHVVVGGTQ